MLIKRLFCADVSSAFWVQKFSSYGKAADLSSSLIYRVPNKRGLTVYESFTQNPSNKSSISRFLVLIPLEAVIAIGIAQHKYIGGKNATMIMQTTAILAAKTPFINLWFWKVRNF